MTPLISAATADADPAGASVPGVVVSVDVALGDVVDDDVLGAVVPDVDGSVVAVVVAVRTADVTAGADSGVDAARAAVAGATSTGDRARTMVALFTDFFTIFLRPRLHVISRRRCYRRLPSANAAHGIIEPSLP
jgi:hypothetical protein